MQEVTIPNGFAAYVSEVTGAGGVATWTLCFAPANSPNPWTDPAAIKVVMSGGTYDSLNAYISGK